jgi:hypothetical protein
MEIGHLRQWKEAFQGLAWSLLIFVAAMFAALPPASLAATPQASLAVSESADLFAGVTTPLATSASFWQSKADSASKSQLKGAQAVLEAYQNQQSNVIVENVVGSVEVLLRDDLDGDRHQRFIIRLASGQTVLVVHNIDIAPRVANLAVGDRVTIAGEYEWNDRGGLIHWTHRDPRSSHADGWIEHNRVRYE